MSFDFFSTPSTLSMLTGGQVLFMTKKPPLTPATAPGTALPLLETVWHPSAPVALTLTPGVPGVTTRWWTTCPPERLAKRRARHTTPSATGVSTHASPIA